MIAPTIINIFLHGMIALVHNRPGDGYMSAYLVKDAEHPHGAYLSFEMNDASRCETARFKNTYCFKVGSVCLCHIGDPVNMRFDPTSLSDKVAVPRHGSARPFRLSDAESFSWLVKMSDVDGDRGGAKVLDQVRDFVLADLSFGWQRALACELDQVQDTNPVCIASGNCEYQIYPNRFQSSLSSSLGHVQALAEGVMFEVGFPNNQVKLIIKDRDSGSEIKLYLGCPNEKCPDLEIDNDFVEDHASDMFEDVGAHFLNYYNLALGDNPKKKFPVRLREGAVPLSVGMSQLNTCPSNPRETNHQKIIQEQGGLDDELKTLVKQYDDAFPEGIQTRIICPMAMFEN